MVLPDMAVWMSRAFALCRRAYFPWKKTQITLTLGFSAARAHDTEHGGAACHVVFHFSMPSAGLMEMRRIKRDGFADETDDGARALDLRECR